MTRITVNEGLRSVLYDFSRPLEICDESGRVLGRFLPTIDTTQYEGLEPRVSREEVRRRKETKGKTFTTDEVLRHLESL